MQVRTRKKILFALAPVFLLLLAGETAARVKLYLQSGQAYYLVAPFGKGTYAPAAPVERKLHVVRLNAPATGQGGRPAAKADRNSETDYYKMPPGVHDALPPLTTKYRINSLGFRGEDFDPKVKAPGVTRIFCVGQSSTFGMESADNETWPGRLAHYLAERKPGAYEVINAGFDGYYSHHMRNLVLGELGNYQPDMLIIYGGLNDVNFENNLEKKSTSALALAVHQRLYYRWSMLYTLVSEKASVMMQGNPAVGIGYVDKTSEHFASNMGAIMRWCKSRNVRCVAVREMVHAAPALYLRDSLTLKEAQDSVSTTPRDASGAAYAPPLTLYRYVQLAASFKALSAANGVPFLDLRPAMFEAIKQGKKLMYDYGHLTAAANDILGREIARHIE
jgi:lysophospholipase L1-like esterase